MGTLTMVMAARSKVVVRGRAGARRSVAGRAGVSITSRRSTVRVSASKRSPSPQRQGCEGVVEKTAAASAISSFFATAPALAAQQVSDLAVAEMPNPAGTMNGALPAIATLLFIFIPVAFLLILYIKGDANPES